MRKSTGQCSVTRCDKPGWARDWCQMHYFRWRRTGTVEPSYSSLPVHDRFILSYSAEPDGCWMWINGVNSQGYARISIDNARVYAHRYSFEHYVGEIPDGLDLDHLCHTADPTCFDSTECRHRRCVNPEHLEPVTRKENLARQHRSVRT